MDDRLRSGVAELGLALSDTQFAQLNDYAQALKKWGRVYNLTALRDDDEVLTHHLLDSLAVVARLRKVLGAEPARLLDVGSGAGLPGVVLAIAMPQLQVDCVDAVAKKVAFIQQASGLLKLGKLRGVHSRVEALQGQYEVITSRAFSSLADFTRLTQHLLTSSGVWMAMKGKYPADEVAALPAGVAVFHVEQLRVPGLDAERCVLWLRQAAP